MTKVINVRKEHFYVYDKNYVYIGRPSIFGNPFKIGEDGDREEVIAKYRQHFYDKIRTDPGFKSDILKLQGKVLGCFCKPLACHGDVVAEYLNNLKGESNGNVI